MKRSPSPSYRLKAIAGDRSTEIFLVDSKLQRIQSGIGTLEADVPRGIYKVRFRSGSSLEDQLVEVSGKEPEVVVEAQRISFRSAAPIWNTQTTHEYHSDPASEISRLTSQSLGQGAELFVFVRDEVLDASEFVPGSVTIHDFEKGLVVSLDAGREDSARRWAGLNLELDPGVYTVRVETGSLGSYELFVVLSPGWQTQVFLVMEDFYSKGEKVRRPSLRQACVLMARVGRGFDPGRDDARLVELGRLGLVQGRSVVSEDDMEGLLRGKLDDPLLGIFAAHLLLAQRSSNYALIEKVCAHLEGALEGVHPDLQALSLARGAAGAGTVETMSYPPMLRKSWDLVVSATRRRASLIPPDSPAGRVGKNVVNAEPWLLHRVPEEAKIVPQVEDTTIAQGRRITHRFLEQKRVELHKRFEEAEGSGVPFDSLEQSIFQILARRPSFVGTEELTSKVEDSSEEEGEERMEERVRSVGRALRKLDAPSYTLASSIKSLASKLKIP